jgi:hypothetical protein
VCQLSILIACFHEVLFINFTFTPGIYQSPKRLATLWTTRVRYQGGASISLFAFISRLPSSPTSSPVQWAQVFFTRNKSVGVRSQTLPLSSAEVMNQWRFSSSASYVVMARCLDKETALILPVPMVRKHRGNYIQNLDNCSMFPWCGQLNNSLVT